MQPRIPPCKSALQEFSVVYTERATNLMDLPFRLRMKDSLLPILREAYNAQTAIIIPGSGTFAMEAVARQFAMDAPTIICRNGLFSFRWSAILETARTKVAPKVLMAQASADSMTYEPCAIATVVQTIKADKPKVVFAPHVETATGIILSDDYLTALGQACREVDALFVLDCVASGAVWVDMKAKQVDVIISAPQKGWSGPACCGFVMLGERAVARLATSQSSSFSLDLKIWDQVWTEKYAKGEFMYHTTLPTDALLAVAAAAEETRAFGFEKARQAQLALGAKVRAMLARKGFKSVAPDWCAAPGVVVVHNTKPALVQQLIKCGIQVAGGVPFKLGEPASTATFRVGLFGLDKWANVDATVSRLEQGLEMATNGL